MLVCNVQLSYRNGHTSLYALDVDTVTDIICITDPEEVVDRICEGEWYPPIVNSDVVLAVTYGRGLTTVDPETLIVFHKALQQWYDDNIDAINENYRRREDYK